MFRPLSALTLGACILMAGCNPSDPARDESPAEAMAGAGEAVPADYDWHFVPEGGSGDLDFGDGDWAEGVKLVSMGCLPNSQEVRLFLGDEPDVVLTAGTATGTFRNDTPAPANHAVFTALRAGEDLAVGSDHGDLMLEAKAAGKRAVQDFFTYCTTPLPAPEPEVITPAPDAAATPTADATTPESDPTGEAVPTKPEGDATPPTADPAAQ